jgi:hypothetical protein
MRHADFEGGSEEGNIIIPGSRLDIRPLLLLIGPLSIKNGRESASG